MSASKNLEYEKTSFLNKSNSAFIERMYLKFVNKDADLPDSWKDYFEGIGDELNIIAKEINGPSWGPKKNTVDIDELQKKIDEEDYNSNGDVSISNNINLSSSGSNEDSIKALLDLFKNEVFSYSRFFDADIYLFNIILLYYFSIWQFIK